MPSASSIVNVTASPVKQNPTRAGFGTPAVLAYHTRFADRFRRYSSLDSMLDDGFQSYDDAYRMAAAYFDQDETVPEVIVGRLPSAPAYTKTFTIITNTEGLRVKGKLISPATGTVNEVDYLIPAAVSTDDVATAVAALMDAFDGIDASAVGSVITITPTVAGRQVHVYQTENAQIADTTADAGYDTELALLKTATKNGFYAFSIDCFSSANVQDCSSWAISNKRIFFATLIDHLETTAGAVILPALNALSGNKYTAVQWSNNSHVYNAARWAAYNLPKDPGSTTWTNHGANGAVADDLSETEEGYVWAEGGGTFTNVLGFDIFFEGKAVSGDWLDVVRGLDALMARVQENGVALLYNSVKIPMTEGGIETVRANILASAAEFEGTDREPGFLVQGLTNVIVPEVDAITDTEKAIRDLDGFALDVTVATPINKFRVRITLI